MMNNLFLIFDPSTNLLNLSINWISTFIGLLFFLILIDLSLIVNSYYEISF